MRVAGVLAPHQLRIFAYKHPSATALEIGKAVIYAGVPSAIGEYGMVVDALFEPSKIGPLMIKNRFVRSATSETMALPDGSITESYINLYRNLARGGAGLILTGHMFVHPRGRYYFKQAGIHVDALIPALRRCTQAVHREDGTIFAELGHAGSQCRVPSMMPIAPSRVENVVSKRLPDEATEADIDEAIRAYGSAARRAREAGFDGLHIHGGHGYLISEFNSPHGNRRVDGWGGSAEKRSRFIFAVYHAVRHAVGTDFPITIKLGMADAIASGGLELSESVERAIALEQAGVDAIEVTIGIMHLRTKRFVGVTPKRAFEDLVLHRLIYQSTEEAYFRPFARALKVQLKTIPVILVGGIRTTEMMARIVNDGEADFISMARPLIREPDIPNQIQAGRRGLVDCVSCDMCAEHEGIDSLQCWRVDKRKLLEHLVFRLKRHIGLSTEPD
jgi:2,4-dienoyl-CoA reductase-like NADH-dependent reductase (Old Yellow Enzyme family)